MSDIDVLHISEAYGGGVQSAISRYMENSSDLTHGVLVRSRPEHDIKEYLNVELLSHRGNLPSFLLEARAYIRTTRPRIVHLHSSFAGLLRFFSFGHDVKLIYTPHAYSFLRRDTTRATRILHRVAETLLSRRKQTIAAISPFEAAVAARMAGGSVKVTYLPNVVPSVVPAVDETQPTRSRPEVITVGRISAQKDPTFFAAVVTAAKSNVSWVWVGDGDETMRSHLERCGVTVTGWLPNDVVRKRIAEADLYFHSASWEGAPITLLEAAAASTPVLARGIDALTGLGYSLVDDCAFGAAKAVDRFFTDKTFRVQVDTVTKASVHVHSCRVQSDALRVLYGNAI